MLFWGSVSGFKAYNCQHQNVSTALFSLLALSMIQVKRDAALWHAFRCLGTTLALIPSVKVGFERCLEKYDYVQY